MAIRDRLTNLFGHRDGVVEEQDLRVRVGRFTSIGNFRDTNEDRIYIDEARLLYMVTDGIGGQAGGEQAAQLAVEIIVQQLEDFTTAITDPEEIQQRLHEAIVAANEAIIAQGIADPRVKNMGTTVAMAVLRAGKFYIAHVGDSRAYILRNKQIAALTTDHNLAWALFQSGTIGEDELMTHRFRNVLYRYLGSKEAMQGPDIVNLEAVPGDRLLLVTDGVTGDVTDEMLCTETYKVKDPQKCAERLVHLSLDEGSKDNVTVVALYVEEANSPIG